MTLVIDIPDETVNAIKDNVMFGVIPSEILWDVTSAIVNGTPLPKGHGRIIDESKITSVYYHEEGGAEPGTLGFRRIVIDRTNAPTIIESEE